MRKNDIVKARVNGDLKHNVESILSGLGLTISEAIVVYLYQIQLYKGLPFEIKMPNKETLETFKKTDKGIDVIKTKNLDDLFDDLDI
jgi:DNA-damage-inducible protein J